jgi:hypothetical protein
MWFDLVSIDGLARIKREFVGLDFNSGEMGSKRRTPVVDLLGKRKIKPASGNTRRQHFPIEFI